MRLSALGPKCGRPRCFVENLSDWLCKGTAMLLAALVVAFLGVSAQEDMELSSIPREEKTSIFDNAMKVVQNSGRLNLQWLSRALENKTAHCLVSDFINTTVDGAIRTLQTNVKFNRELHPDWEYSNSKTNISITLEEESPFPSQEKSPFPSLGVTDEEDMLPDDWIYPLNVVHADMHCLVIEADFMHGRQNPCVVWGLEEGNSSGCFQVAEERCLPGIQVDAEKCAAIEEGVDQA